ncbi:hypothetical protein SAMD00019534_080900 [Acytostelium subglobosum LB1]|uniref:hypothetical protein n=1 Tax=Acytostelium subglobosum LB1 TaxID=1410327 RepID=UPI000644C7B7|nr:hypothetical protein SAMD00019534_080900 [Acytostelium subglobosum LB1]GAM24915.1 hypothetical protein SAMD00019534_080900 [Acytostelium subglobosum LB1]|eukprot:XP_012752004.1 hypothetical protein SAMD00019534_080900 [Acytostelium subglobosum LB1]
MSESNIHIYNRLDRDLSDEDGDVVYVPIPENQSINNNNPSGPVSSGGTMTPQSTPARGTTGTIGGVDLGGGTLTKRVSIFESVPDQPITYEDLGIAPGTNALEAKHILQNHMFGFRPFKSHISKKRLQDRSPLTRGLYSEPASQVDVQKSLNSVGNYIYAILFGWILYLVFAIVSIILFISYFGIPYGNVIWKLKDFVLWPFGKYFQRRINRQTGDSSEKQPLKASGNNPSFILPQSTSLRVGMVVYYLIGAPILAIFQGLFMMFSWFIVVMIPTAKMHHKILHNLFVDPLGLRVETQSPRTDSVIVLYPVEAINLQFYKFNVSGMNVCLVNLLPFVILSLIFGYFFEEHIHPTVIFLCCILSTIPLSYYNCKAIASLSAQTSFAIGALINTSFGSIIELILYVASLNKGQVDVARAAVTGSLMGAMLLIPGLAMVVGGLKHKEQRFNHSVMGVSMVLLMVAIVGIFSPTVLYKVFGSYQLTCSQCTTGGTGGDGSLAGSISCGVCEYFQANIENDPIYLNKARSLQYAVSAVLPIAYFIGLLFTLKTHRHILHQTENVTGGAGGGAHGHSHGGSSSGEEEEEGEGESEWSRTQCIVILLFCTTLFALVSEKLVDTIDPVVQAFHLTPQFLGITILGVVPTAAEYLNAVQFALNNNMPLALEIGACGSVQITLFQVPVLIFISAIMSHFSGSPTFNLIFPTLDFYAVFFGAVVMNLVLANGKTNYFIGSTLCIVYLIIVFLFFFMPTH